MTEYINLLECDKEEPDIDPSIMNKETIKAIEARHEENKAKRLKENG